jgi:uroporphyrinogen-III synthase
MHILITRPAEDAALLGEKLQARGHQVTGLPMISIDYLKPEAPEAPVDAHVFTSANGVRAAVKAGVDVQMAYAVGPATAAACQAAGWDNIITGTGDVDGLVATILAAPPEGRILHVSGRDKAGDLLGGLRQAGLSADNLVLYRAVARPAFAPETVAAIGNRQYDAVLFYSSRTAQIFIALAQQAGLQDCLAAMAAGCLSPAVAQTAAIAGFAPIWTAASPNEDALLEALPPAG